MDAVDFAGYRGLLPRKVQRWIGVAVLAVAVLAPTRFQAWYLHQTQVHAQHLTEEFLDLMLPTPEPAVDTTNDRGGARSDFDTTSPAPSDRSDRRPSNVPITSWLNNELVDD